MADVGCGSGYYSLRLAEAVGPTGKVYANDIQPEMLAIVRNKMKARNITNIEPIQCTVTDPKLPAGKIDLILMVDVYHEFSHPYEVMVELVKSLAPGGRIVFVEFRLEDPKVPIKLVHKMSKKQVLKEMEPHAVRHVETLDHLPLAARDHFREGRRRQEGELSPRTAEGAALSFPRSAVRPRTNRHGWV